MTLYEKAVKAVGEGKPFTIDFEKRNLKIGRKYLIKEGENLTDLKLINNDMEDKFKRIEELYMNYKYSYPSERSLKKEKNSYFKALPFEKLSEEELIFGDERELAKIKLEAYILFNVMEQQIKWDNNFGNYFYQGKDEDLIILRSWIEN